MSTRIELYEAANVSEYVWPDTEYGRYAKRYLLPLLAEGSESFVRNVRTRLLMLSVDGIPIPVTVNEEEYDNSYVCSPYTHYVSYAKQELVLLGNRVLIGCLNALLSGVGYLLKRADFNRIVHVNNWLLSTNLSPELDEAQWDAVLEKLLALFPGHAIALRSLCPSLNKRAIDSLQARGCILVPSRQVYLLRTDKKDFGSAKSRWLLKRDGALAAKAGYVKVGPSDITESDLPGSQSCTVSCI